jgi:uncharacterized protein (DUF983 family)
MRRTRTERRDAEIEMVLQNSAQSVSPMAAGLTCCCPRCGKGKLFVNVLNMREACDVCGLDYKFVDTGDGPAVFAIFILGFLCLGGALVAEFVFGVPWWAHVLLWGILTPLIAVFLLRFLKATLIALQFRNNAEEGRLSKE